MTWNELNEARRKLGLTEEQMAKLLAVGLSTYKGWGTRNKVPPYICASMYFILEILRNINMIVAKNPSDEKIYEIASRSDHNATKWITDLSTGDTYHWPASDLLHAQVAAMLHVKEYDKGIAAIDS